MFLERFAARNARISLFFADNDASVTGGTVKGPRKATPQTCWTRPSPSSRRTSSTYTRVERIEDGTDGTFDRLQLLARYESGHTSED